MESIEHMLRAHEERAGIANRRKSQLKRLTKLRSQSLAQQRSVERSKHRLEETPTALAEPASKASIAKNSEQVLVFSAEKLQQAYRKIDAYKIAQRIREKNRSIKKTTVEQQTEPLQLKFKAEELRQVGQLATSPKKVKRQYSQEVVSALMQLKMNVL